MLVVCVTFRNARPFIRRCVESIKAQAGAAFRCIIFDDASSDGSASEIADLIDPQCVLVRNRLRQWQLGNWCQLANRADIDDEDVVVTVDGDDWLPDEAVLERVQAAYADGQTWLTYGNFQRVGRAGNEPGFCRKVPRAAAVRDLPWMSSALRTFKAFLFRAIDDRDLRDESGNWYRSAGDMAIMFPMIEMAGDERAKCLPDVNYIYNMDNPLSDFRVNKAEQEQNDLRLRSGRRYRLLDREPRR